MAEKRIKVGMLGGGMMSQVGHLPFYLNDPRCEVVCIAESRPSLIEALSKQVGAGRLEPDYRVMLANAEVDAVILSAPRPATGPLTLEILEAGKHVMAEKPMAHTAEQARKLVEAASARKLIYAVGFMKRYDPGVQAAKALFDEVCDDGRLGRLLFARFYDYSNSYAHPIPPHTRPAESRTGRFDVWELCPDWLPEQYRSAYPWFLNAASHDVNLLSYFFPGDVALLSAAAPSEASVVAAFTHEDTPVSLEITKTTAGRWIEGAEFLFEKGRISLSIPSPMAVDEVASVVMERQENDGKPENIASGAGWCFARQATGFIDALTGETPPLTSGEDGLADMEMSEAIWRKISGCA